jgi:hypothetical protein
LPLAETSILHTTFESQTEEENPKLKQLCKHKRKTDKKYIPSSIDTRKNILTEKITKLMEAQKDCKKVCKTKDV